MVAEIEAIGADSVRLRVRARRLFFALVVVSSALSIAVAELILRAVTPFPIGATTNRVFHPRLGYVLARDFPDADVHGFRNRGTTLESAEIVVIGDSHAYGNNVSADASFPAQLGRELGRPVYNMGMGSFGIYHYMVLMDDLAARPVREVVLAFYPSNDLTMHCSITALPYWPDYARSRGLRVPPCEDEAGPAVESQGPLGRVRQWSVEHAALFSAFDQLIWQRIRSARAFDFPLALVLTTRRVEAHAMDASLGIESARLHYANSLRILEQASASFERSRIGFSVLLIPSRERVLSEWSRRHGFAQARLEELVEYERELTARYEGFFRDHEIAHLDALGHVLSAFEAEFRAGHDFYPWTDDGHPFESGYRAYASAAVELLAQRGHR